MSRGPYARPLPILATLIGAMMLEIVPLPAWVEPMRPEWLALTIMYWAMYVPQRIGVGAAWTSGLVLDALTGALLGQYALAFTMLAFITRKFHLRIRVFPISQQMVAAAILIAVVEFLIFWVDGVAGAPTDDPRRWLPILSSALLWPVVLNMLNRVRRRVGTV